MNTSTSTTTTTCPLAKENGTEIVSPTGSELTSISLDVEQANNDASALDASPKAKTMKEFLILRYGYGRGLAVLVVIALALAGKAFVSCAHNDLTGTDDMMRNVDLGIDSSKQVALLELEGDGNNVAGYDLTKVDGGVSTVRTLEQGQDPTIIYEFTKVGDGMCGDSNNNQFDSIVYVGGLDVDECKAKCAACPGQGQAAGRELRGFWFIRGGHAVCTCYLEDGLIVPSTSPVCRRSVTQGTGATGAICNIIPRSICAGECWKVVDSNLQCPTPAPTLQCPTSPTPAPTNEPTSSPSMSPTQSPSTAPTAPPSMAPTASPSKAPTTPPTMAPTESPSTAPTAPPTMAPTESPSTAPTAPPSMAPTASPTAPPSMAPTAPPTASPTMAPTESPSMAPTASPTTSPSTAPTNAHSKSGKVGKANGIVDLQVQEMKSGGSSVSISPHVVILALIVASRNSLATVFCS